MKPENISNYDARRYWNFEGDLSSPGVGDDPGKFSNYKLPSWKTSPQWWEYIERGMKVLDIGSGIGLQVGKLLERGVHAVGCDISDKLISVARENCLQHGIESPAFVLWNGWTLPFKNNSFDRVLTNTVLQHVVDDIQLKEILQEVSRVMSPDGLFLMSEITGILTMKTASHVRIRSQRNYVNFASSSGLRTLSCQRTAKTFLTLGYGYRFLSKSTQSCVPGRRLECCNVACCRTGNKEEYKEAIKDVIIWLCGVIDTILNKLRLFPLIVTQDSIVFKKL